MKHAREDYDRIQDPAKKIGKDEPVMLFRAQDVLMPKVLKHYALLLMAEGAALKMMGGDPSPLWEMAAVVDDFLTDVREWQLANGAKLPDLARVGPKEGAVSGIELKT